MRRGRIGPGAARLAAALLCALPALSLSLSTLPARADEARQAPPARVVSINLCTDQLAMLLAAEGQLHSVSHIATDPRMSPMVEEARRYRPNHGRAEEIYLMRPDLVLAGPYTSPATTALLERLGIPVAIIPAASRLEDVRRGLLRMGEALHREEAAEAAVAGFDARLAALPELVETRPRAVIYQANGYTTGDETLAGQILLSAGFANAAAEAGYGAGSKLPLEVLALLAPELVITARPYPGGSRAEAVQAHPVVRAFRPQGVVAAGSDADWICGTPYVLRAIDRLAEARRALAP
ncbi:MAG: ABC transporter substrate-binding protein [Roseovarius sp.]